MKTAAARELFDMPEYLLPCSCGEQTRVTATQAGQSVRCVCGSVLLVPNLRDLKRLEHAEQAWQRQVHKWEDRHRTAFLLGLFAIVALSIAGWLFTGLPRAPERPTTEEIQSMFDRATVREVMATYRALEHGLRALPAPPPNERRRATLWGIGLALVTSGCCLIGAAVVLTVGNKDRQGQPEFRA